MSKVLGVKSSNGDFMNNIGNRFLVCIKNNDTYSWIAVDTSVCQRIVAPPDEGWQSSFDYLTKQTLFYKSNEIQYINDIRSIHHVHGDDTTLEIVTPQNVYYITVGKSDSIKSLSIRRHSELYTYNYSSKAWDIEYWWHWVDALTSDLDLMMDGVKTEWFKKKVDSISVQDRSAYLYNLFVTYKKQSVRTSKGQWPTLGDSDSNTRGQDNSMATNSTLVDDSQAVSKKNIHDVNETENNTSLPTDQGNYSVKAPVMHTEDQDSYNGVVQEMRETDQDQQMLNNNETNVKFMNYSENNHTKNKEVSIQPDSNDNNNIVNHNNVNLEINDASLKTIDVAQGAHLDMTDNVAVVDNVIVSNNSSPTTVTNKEAFPNDNVVDNNSSNLEINTIANKEAPQTNSIEVTPIGPTFGTDVTTSITHATSTPMQSTSDMQLTDFDNAIENTTNKQRDQGTKKQKHIELPNIKPIKHNYKTFDANNTDIGPQTNMPRKRKQKKQFQNVQLVDDIPIQIKPLKSTKIAFEEKAKDISLKTSEQGKPLDEESTIVKNSERWASPVGVDLKRRLLEKKTKPLERTTSVVKEALLTGVDRRPVSAR